ncbi:MAG TPA: hypothetical protein VFX77_00570 [Rubrobacter sp.]|nr:hypothetical protein [Rubrobacter sp.]
MMVQKVFVLMATVSAVIVLSSWEWQAPAQAAQHEEANKDGGSGNLTLRIAGDTGTPFSGACSVGGKEHDISGQVPQSFEYQLDSQELECEIGKQGDESGALKVVLSSEVTRSVQRVEGKDVTLRLTYSRGSVSSSMTSSSSQLNSSSSSSQTVISSNSSSSSSKANGDEGGGGEDAESLAERIIERVFKDVGLEN